jgi:hypothetical protein
MGSNSSPGSWSGIAARMVKNATGVNSQATFTPAKTLRVGAGQKI